MVERWFTWLLLASVVVVVRGTGNNASIVCHDECASHRNGSYHCANAHCFKFPDAPGTVQKIYLQHNDIMELPELNYPQLILLNLTENHLTEIPEDTFAYCGILEVLLLGSNKIRTISSHSFRGLENSLENLDLSHNGIVDIETATFSRFDKLTTLNLNDNKITQLGINVLSDISHLKWLHLMGNVLEAVNEDSFQNLPNLEHLDLQANRITTIGKKSFGQCPKLKTLDLFNNSISTIEPYAFQNAEKLQIIHLQHNQISVLDNRTFLRMSRMGGELQSVYLDWNPLAVIPAKVFPRSVTRISMNNLEKLDFIDEDVFAQIHHINELMINNNPQLGRIHENAFGCEQKTPVSVIQLTNNSLKGLAQDTFDWSSVTFADLRDNPWHCDCNMRWMVDEDSKVLSETRATTLCKAPDYLEGKALSQVPKDQFSCAWYANYKRRIIRGLILLVLVGSILLILGCLFKNRKKILSRCTNSDFRYKTVGFNTSRAEDCEVDIDLYRGNKKKLPRPEDADNDEI